MYVYKNEQLQETFSIAAGTPDTPSPLGVWRITYKAKDWGSGFGTRWLRLSVPWGIYGIHGTNKPGSIGSHASHGCIRMQNRQVEQLYSMVPVGTQVIIAHGTYGSIGPWYRELTPGDRGSAVLEVQNRLVRMGYLHTRPDGVFGEATRSALLRMKREKNLPGNDHVDRETYGVLGILWFD